MMERNRSRISERPGISDSAAEKKKRKDKKRIERQIERKIQMERLVLLLQLSIHQF